MLGHFIGHLRYRTFLKEAKNVLAFYKIEIDILEFIYFKLMIYNRLLLYILYF